MKLLTSIALLAVSLSSVYAGLDIAASFSAQTADYNVDEDVTMMCVVTSDESFRLGFSLTWYKRQDSEYHVVGRADNLLVEPFNNKDKYNVGFDTNYENNIATFHASIKGVEMVDSGDYKCVVGYKDLLEESDPLRLEVRPDEARAISFNTDAPYVSEKSSHAFNEPHQVTCRATSDSISSDLGLRIKLGDGTEVSQAFTQTSVTTWTGEDGLKLPTTTHRLEASNWKPTKSGPDSLNCYYEDGDRQLAIMILGFTREETATVNCSTNYKVPIRIDDIDVYITCRLHNYHGPQDMVELKWEFTVNNETITLNTGENKHHRKAERVDGAYRLGISRVTADMVSSGKYFPYEAKVYRKDTEAPIASTTFHLNVDSTSRSTNGSPAKHASLMPVLVLIPALLALLY